MKILCPLQIEKQLTKMKNREEAKREILDLFTAKKTLEIIVSNIRAEIDRKAIEIKMTANERVEIILESKRTFDNKV